MSQALHVLIRRLGPDELGRIREIDRAERIRLLYTYEEGRLLARPVDLDVQGWPPGELDNILSFIARELEQGGTSFGALDGDRLVGVAVLGGRFRDEHRDQLQLVFMHVSNGHRRRGIGSRLMAEAASLARERGARSLYISATPSDSAVGFYTHHGSRPAPTVDAELFALEPEDIHLIKDL